jgi:hypothetical protein
VTRLQRGAGGSPKKLVSSGYLRSTESRDNVNPAPNTLIIQVVNTQGTVGSGRFVVVNLLRR